MNHLLIVAHGSRRQASNEEIERMAQKAHSLTQNFDRVTHAFLEIASPTIREGIQNCIENGAKRIVIMPCFLSEGVHVKQDIPDEVKTAQDENPDIEMSIAPYIGSSEDLITLMLNLAKTV